jgi:uncharacterized protein RhaS with RHS repeats
MDNKTSERVSKFQFRFAHRRHCYNSFKYVQTKSSGRLANTTGVQNVYSAKQSFNYIWTSDEGRAWEIATSGL